MSSYKKPIREPKPGSGKPTTGWHAVNVNSQQTLSPSGRPERPPTKPGPGKPHGKHERVMPAGEVGTKKECDTF
ncbi:hypothetical protein PV04_00626 [Phialophora macrospora]|uniref:Uncharacterized protein n=1 Tax=Phialophora macrospora TaxID=1851006 RepID=A0A0D2D4E9_9EURO|nr:hypothetical protein PV04_00626 [Phialophora macrospora]